VRACPLCTDPDPGPFYEERGRRWLRCAACDLVFVPVEHHLDPAAERAQYDLHRNDPADEGYRRFLGRLVDPLLARLPARARVLDFGCGPGPTLSMMLVEAGHRVALYDKFYAPDRGPLAHSYDAVTATEVVEHLARPGEVLASLWGRVRPGGVLGLMTRLRPADDRFAGWHYRRDPTHVALYSAATVGWIAAWLGADLALSPPDVALLGKPVATGGG
jgi:SAM-dependent methyltransferase